ncbi:MAG: hypothetical protein LBQ38_02885 [Spirochaetaceae bacterium]|jgi:hypothetical protein|nr:hypothetical protein [Spirochaetaceae bacterium]
MKRTTFHVFDAIFKRLMRLSGKAIVFTINGFFGADHPPDSPVIYPNTETVGAGLRRLISDMVIHIDGWNYHIETQIRDDENISLRVFDYGLALGRQTPKTRGGRTVIRFPRTRIIYWEAGGKTQDTEVLRLEFFGGSYYDYEVKTFKFLNYSIRELAVQGLTILLPFYVLKLRKAVQTTRLGRKRQALAVEMKGILKEITETVEAGVRAGHLTEADKREVLGLLERLFRELYGGYTEFREEHEMLKEEILTLTDELVAEAKREAREEAKKEAREEALTLTDELVEKAKKEAREEALTLADELVEKAKREAREEAKKEAREEALTLADELVEKARAELLVKHEREKLEIARNFITMGFAAEQVAKATGLPVDRVKTLV